MWVLFFFGKLTASSLSAGAGTSVMAVVALATASGALAMMAMGAMLAMGTTVVVAVMGVATMGWRQWGGGNSSEECGWGGSNASGYGNASNRLQLWRQQGGSQIGCGYNFRWIL
jgi:hypothetical protein